MHRTNLTPYRTIGSDNNTLGFFLSFFFAMIDSTLFVIRVYLLLGVVFSVLRLIKKAKKRKQHPLLYNNYALVDMKQVLLCQEKKMMTDRLRALQTDYNFPILYQLSIWLEELRNRHKKRKLWFVTRDCCLWKPLFNRLFPTVPTETLFCSRACLQTASDSYVRYFYESVDVDRDFVVDLRGTGQSFAQFIKKTKQRTYFPLSFLVIPFASRGSEADYRSQFHHLPALGDSYMTIESCNHDLTCSVLDVTENHTPIYAQYDGNRALVRVMHDAFHKALEKVPMSSPGSALTFDFPYVQSLVKRWLTTENHQFLERNIQIQLNHEHRTVRKS